MTEATAIQAAHVEGAMNVAELSDILDVGCLVIDRNYEIKVWNSWLASASGRSAQDVVGRNLFELFPGLKGTARQQALDRALAGEAVMLAHVFHEYFLDLPTPAGFDSFERMQQSTRILPVLSAEQVTGAVVVIQDVSERVHRERDLTEARVQAETASRAKSDFLASVSHELRTPLTAILGYADLLDSHIGGTLTATQTEHVNRIVAGTWHLIKIIDEILSFSRAEAQKYELVLERVNVCDVAHQATALLEALVREKGLEFDVRVPNTPVMVHTDALRLRQILLNVIGNAVKFTDRGRVSVDMRESGTWLTVVVSDTGPGIPPHMHRAVFEPFVQADQSNTRKKGGTGLGLALSRKLAELLGGELTLEKSDANGTTFMLRLPMQSVEPVEPGA